MEKPALVGIDVSARKLDVRVEWAGRSRALELANDAEGHRKLVRILTKGGRTAQVVLEPTGVYHLELARTLHRTKRVAVMVVNPAALRSFARALRQRGKSDPDDALCALEYARRMEFRLWTPPAEACFALRALARHIDTVLRLEQQEVNRRHALERQGLGALVEEVDAHLAFLRQQIRSLEAQALKRIEGEAELKECFALLCTVPGVAHRSGIRLLAELAVLPRDMTRRQWVAHAGLDPCRYQSGSSILQPPRISRRGNRRLRAALYMPALVAVRCDERVRAFYEELLATGKPKRKALTAVMRKLLHAIWGVLQHHQPFQSTRFRQPQGA